MEITTLRSEIPTIRHMTYLNTGWAGPSPLSVGQAIRDRLEYEDIDGPTSPEVIESRNGLLQQAREAVAGLLNVNTNDVVLTQNTTEGLNVVMSGLPWQEGDEIITTDLEHAAITAPIILAQRQRGVKARVLTIAPYETHASILSKVEDALTDRTRMIFLSHVEYSCGLRMPVKEIRELTRSREVWMLLDGAQSAGHISVDIQDIGCDFYSIPGQKWLLGPDGTGALYINEAIMPVLESHWAGYDSIEEFNYPTGHKIKTDADKLSISTWSAPLRAGFTEGIRFVQEAGVKRIEQRNLVLASRLKEGLYEAPGVRVLSPMEGPGCSGLVSFSVDGVDSEEAATKFWKKHRILLRHVTYPPCLRASLDFFNTEDEVAQLVDAVTEMVKNR